MAGGVQVECKNKESSANTRKNVPILREPFGHGDPNVVVNGGPATLLNNGTTLAPSVLD